MRHPIVVLALVAAMTLALSPAEGYARPGRTTRLSPVPGGSEPTEYSGYNAISADGRFVAFHSYVDKLVPPVMGTGRRTC